MIIQVGSRSSNLAKAQVFEVWEELKKFHPDIVFEVTYVQTTGDLDKKTSLRDLDKTDFFTKEIDELVLQKKCRIGIHSAKDLPDPLAKGLEIVALTKGLDCKDSLVFNNLPWGATVATSSKRRQDCVNKIRPDCKCVDIRGTIEERLQKMYDGEVDGVVIAEAALIRLKIECNRIKLPGETAAFQGRLAVLAKEDDLEMKEIFKPLMARQMDLSKQQMPL